MTTKTRLIVMMLAFLSFHLSANILMAKNASILADSTSGNKTSNAAAQMDVFAMPATVHNELSGKNIPAGVTAVEKLSARVCRGEFEPFSILIQPKAQLTNVRFNWTDFVSSAGQIIPQNKLDVSIAKVWYQSGYKSDLTETGLIKHLTQEVLVKNDALIKVDYATQKNYLQVSRNGSQFYQVISDANVSFPSDVEVKDSPTLLPFDLDGTTNRQMWLTIQVPDNTPSGKYVSMFTVTSDQGEIKTFPIEIEVLPFELAPSRLTYSIYYNGYADKYTYVPFTYTTKTPEQYRLEMQDMKNHGVLYPTTYQIVQNLDLDLQIRKEVGLPNDRLFAVTLETSNPTTTSGLNDLKSRIQQWKDKAAQYGYKEVFAYGIDEATGSTLTSQRQAWQAAHDAGAKVFVAGYNFYIDYVGDLLDVAVIQGDLSKSLADRWHANGKKIYSYSNPQVGQENPELYRRNFGLALWKNGYDGAMNYAYQKYYKSEWNDFDDSRYRDETFTYTTSNGLLMTIEWEGFREGVDDTRYLATLLNKIDAMKKAGKDVSALESWVNSIDPNKDLDQVRSQIIDKILSISTTTDVASEKTVSSTPENFELAQNFPNPFNPSTAIKYSIPQNSMVSLKVYDVLGKEVATLVNEQKSAGSYEVNFNANNLSTGMYIYELKAGSFVQTKKMMLVK